LRKDIDDGAWCATAGYHSRSDCMTHQFRFSTFLLGAFLCTSAVAADPDQAPKAETHMQQVRDALAALGAVPPDTGSNDAGHRTMNRSTHALSLLVG
jgi:hypothetical protein